MNPEPPVLQAVLNRRSMSRLGDPGPTPEQLHAILRAGASAPDHGRLRPWRFVLLEGDARAKFGGHLAEALRTRLSLQGVSATAQQLAKEESKLLRAPLVIAVCASVKHDCRIPVLEQYAATAAACQNMLVAATALGVGSMWRTGDASYDASIKLALGLEETDIITGWLYFGTPENPTYTNDKGKDIDEYVSYWI